MRKLLLLIPLIVACTRMPSTEMVEVTFRLQNGTKSFPNAIVETLPLTMELTLTNVKTTERVTAYTGEPITLPVGEYAVSGYFHPTKVQNVVGTGIFLSYQPSIYIDQNVDINNGETSYILDASFRSWVLAAETGEVSKWTMIMDYKETPVEFLIDNTTMWIFCTGDASARFITTKVYPSDEEHYSTTTFNISTNAAYALNNGGYFVEPGKWYWLHPEEATTSSATMGLRYPNWSEGSW